VRRTGIAIFAIAAIGLLVNAGDAFARGAAEGPVIYVESQGPLLRLHPGGHGYVLLLPCTRRVCVYGANPTPVQNCYQETRLL
jgi:hypothetical protein